MNKYIRISGARQNNLKNISLDIPRDKMVVMTGVSGSGKSSLAFDTLYAEGQMRYVESLSSYARQFLGQSMKANVDSIEGLSPAIAIDQKSTSNNPRSTVGTATEIYDYLRLLWAKIGTPHCPQCGREIKRQSVDQVVNQICTFPMGTRFEILAPIVKGKKGEHKKVIESIRKNGFVRIRVDSNIYDLNEEINLSKNEKHDIEIVIDRLVVKEDLGQRLADSLEQAYELSNDIVIIHLVDNGEEIVFSQKFACPECEISLPEFSPRIFSFNAPYGACKKCAGIGYSLNFDLGLVIADKSLSLRKGAIAAGGWRSAVEGSFSCSYYTALGEKYGFTIDTPLSEFSEKAIHALLYGTGNENLTVGYSNYGGYREVTRPFEGIIHNLERRYKEDRKSASSVSELENYMSASTCPDCNGHRLSPIVLAVTVGELNISDFCNLTIVDGLQFIKKLTLPEAKRTVAESIVEELSARLEFLQNVGLGYLTLARAASTLSGGESQRIRLATQIGSGLTGVLYIFDEPSIGLHQRDNDKLLKSLMRLRDLGNTLIVVEHDEETMCKADWIVDIGPGPGINGGELVAQGTPKDIMNEPNSLTGLYLSHKKYVPIPQIRRKGNGNTLTVYGATEHNLKNLDVSIPLNRFVCVTGVSGSGKSSLVNGVIYKKLSTALNRARARASNFKRIDGIEHLDKVIYIDQSPIGRTPRSNPATYTGLFTDIRNLFSLTNEAKMRAYGAGRFSFNIKGGRCEACAGDGLIKIEMHFLPDIYVPCDICKGKRYNRETLEVKYKGKSIADVLDLTASEALVFFENIPKIWRKINALCKVGLGYIKLGQSSTTLSGGEAQRVKLATELLKPDTGATIYIMDEPTTGLHMADVHTLIDVLHALVDKGNSLLVIEHNLDVIKNADYIIDLGLEGGKEGGEIICVGTPEEVARCQKSDTGKYLDKILRIQV